MCICRCVGSRKDVCCKPSACCQRFMMVTGLATLCIGVMFFSIYEYYLKDSVLSSGTEFNWFVNYWFVYTRYLNLIVGILIPVLMYKYVVKVQQMNNCQFMGYNRKNPCCLDADGDYYRANSEFEQIATATPGEQAEMSKIIQDSNVGTSASSGLSHENENENLNNDDINDISDVPEQWCYCQISAKAFTPLFSISLMTFMSVSFIIIDGVTLFIAKNNCRAFIPDTNITMNICGTLTGSPATVILMSYALIQVSTLSILVPFLFVPFFNKYCKYRLDRFRHTGLHLTSPAYTVAPHETRPTVNELHPVRPVGLNPVADLHSYPTILSTRSTPSAPLASSDPSEL